MTRDRKCILCETVCVSKQEMDEHMRSMLHHRELEKLKGRDCGHECKVCKVKVVSLTDYASHISSPTHKENVEAAERQHARSNHEEDYFDQDLVDLVEKRNKQIRKEKEAASVKLAKEEEERLRKQEFHQRLKEVQERYRLDCVWQLPSQGFSGYSPNTSWQRSHHKNGFTEDSRLSHHNNKQEKSATWHAQDPPDLRKFASTDFSGGRHDSQAGRSNRTWGHGVYSGNKQSRLPWLSNEGSSYGLYGHNNISRYTQKAQHQSFLGQPLFQTQPSFYAQALNQFQSTGNKDHKQDAGFQNQVPLTESDHKGSRNSKPFGSNQKLDKVCRWSPYSISSGPHSDTHSNTSEKPHNAPKHQKQDVSDSNRHSQPEHQSGRLVASRHGEEENERHQTKPKSILGDKSCSSSGGNGCRTGGRQNSAPSASNQKTKKPFNHVDQRNSSVPGVSSGAKHSKCSSQDLPQSKPPGKQSGLKDSFRSLQSRQERFLPESFSKARLVCERNDSMNSLADNRVKMIHQVEEQKMDQEHNQTEQNKEQSQNGGKLSLPVTYRPEEHAPASSDNNKFVQSLQVSTSTTESTTPAASVRKNKEKRKKQEKQTDSAVSDEAMQITEAGQISESDTSRSGDAHMARGTNSSTLSKLELPPVLKRDLTKHISSKSKTTGHEPNLNIARRVRNLSESRRSDTDKDSGLKPTVLQLISSSGSRRNVNWDQVYLEFRKKQDKGKGMPRFGIEMVPNEQECQSQEEDDLSFLEGFQWESLTDISSQDTPRKRSLSESSLAPASTHSPSAAFSSEKRESLISDQLRSMVSPSSISVPEKPEYQCQPEAIVEEQPDKLASASVKVLHRSDSVLSDSSSETEQCDGQGKGKRRRAAREVHDTETSCLEHNSKRRKLKSKRERLQIDQLLTVSLREEELSRSLQNVDTSLIQARAALEAAYVEVQRLIVVKQQISVEMGSLRNKRIELLKGMQGTGTMEEAPVVKLKEEKDLLEMEPFLNSSSVACVSVMDTGISSPKHAAECASPLSSSLPLSLVIKEEPQSPVYIGSEPEPVIGLTHCSPELPATTSPGPVCNLLSSETKLEPLQTNCLRPADCQEKLPGLIETTEKAVQSSSNSNSFLPDSKTSVKLCSPSSRGSEVGTIVDCADNQSVQSPSVFNMPSSPSELRSGKRVRKLKKRKALRKAQGAEQPESSDTEIDGEASRPSWLRQRRRPSGGSQISTSSQPTDDKEINMITDGNENTLSIRSLTVKLVKVDQKSSKNRVEVSQVPPVDPVGSCGDLEESMEITAACQQHQMDTLVPAPPSDLVPDSCQPEQQSLACNEVSSTSDMDLCKSSESDLPFAITLPKNSSDTFSDHGEDDIPTEGLFDGHQEAVNAIQIHNGLLYTCSGDRTIKAFDLVSHKCVGVFEGHSSKVTCLLVSAAPCLHHRLYSGSSDQTIRCYSLKTKELEQQFLLSDRVLCLHTRWRTLYAGLANGSVVTFNLRTNKQMDIFECHGRRGVSCLASSQEGAQRILLVGSHDSTISVRAAKTGLLLRTLEGHTKGVLCMTVINDLVFSGSSDHSVHAYNIHTGELVHVYKGHSHAVTVVTVLGKIMVTACLDKLVRVYDLQSQVLLQAYGGHKDMVLCMAVYKNMIYTGCYDGSVQAVKLNLMQNYHCQWHSCSLVFAVMDHLQQHLINNHISANYQIVKCRWKNCEEFLCTRISSKQMLMLHMQKHVEEQSEVES